MDGENGREVFAQACRELNIDVTRLLVRCARWVNPLVFRRLPLWYPELHRKAQLFKKGWAEPQLNKGVPKLEGNGAAAKALKQALGKGLDRPDWACCHIWGYDDDTFQQAGSITQDRRFYSCVANMVLLPTPLKSLTDASPAIKRMLRICAYHLYGFVPPGDGAERAEIVGGNTPEGYPEEWPASGRRRLPPGCAADGSPEVRRAVALAEKRSAAIAADLEQHALGALPHYPGADVRAARAYWVDHLT